MPKTHAATMSVSLPKELKEYVKQRTATEHYGTPSDYIRGLIREDLKKHKQDRLEALLLEGLSSGAATSMTKKDWQDLRTQVDKRVAQGKRKK